MEMEDKTGKENECSEGHSKSSDGRSGPVDRVKQPKWLALIPAAAGIALLLLGYYLDATVFKVLGLIAAGFVLLLLS